MIFFNLRTNFTQLHDKRTQISFKLPVDLFEMNVLDDDNKRAVVVTAVVKWLYGSAYNAHNTFAIERSTNMYRIA